MLMNKPRGVAWGLLRLGVGFVGMLDLNIGHGIRIYDKWDLVGKNYRKMLPLGTSKKHEVA